MTEKLKQVEENQKASVSHDRRGFLKLASIGTVASGAALLSGQTASAKDASVEASADDNAGYKETKHVKTFYASARF